MKLHIVLLTVLCSAFTANAASFMKWDAVDAGLPVENGKGVKELSAGGQPPSLCAIIDGAGLYRSEDLGATWTKLEGDAACLTAPYAVTVAPNDGKTIFAAPTAGGGGLWRSTDGGKSWEKCGDKAKGMASDEVEWVTIHPTDTQLILVGHRAGKTVSVSADGGTTWGTKEIGTEVPRVRPYFLTDTRFFLASRQDGGAKYWSDNAGGTWTKSEGKIDTFCDPIPAINVGEFVIGSSHHGVNKSVDGGKTFNYTMEQHNRVLGVLGDVLIRKDSSGIPGTKNWRMEIAMSADYSNSWSFITSNLIDLIPEARRAHAIMPTPFCQEPRVSAFAATPDGRHAFLGLFNAGLYRVSRFDAKGGPIIGGERVNPLALCEGDTQTEVAIQVTTAAKMGGIKRVTADLSALKAGTIELVDDGKHDDGAAGDKVYGGRFKVGAGTPAGDQPIGLISEDEEGRTRSVVATLRIATQKQKSIVWNGDEFGRGGGWMHPQSPLCYLKPTTEEVKNGKVALEMHGDGAGWIGGGWNWFGWYPDGSGTDVREFRNLSFWIKAQGDVSGLSVALADSTSKKDTNKVAVYDYCPEVSDGAWHEVVIPLADIYFKTEGINPGKMWELRIGAYAPHARQFTAYLDDIGFDYRPVRPHTVWVRSPEGRDPAPTAPDAMQVTATIDLAAEGKPISPWIYGVAMADPELCKEMGIPMRRAGGNPVSPINWKTGFGAKGADWFFQNEGKETPPEKNWLVSFHGANKQAGMETYLTLPTMGRVAKDGESVAFDTRKYPDQTDWAGKSQPTDRLPNAGSGIQFIKKENGEFEQNEKGEKKTRLIEPDPNDTSIEISPEEQTEMLKFMIEKLSYGTAEQGGVKYVALDNEPALWSSTHRGMHPKGCSYDELWERTRTYSSRLKKIDPNVQVACGTFWGWTAYWYSGLDSQLVGQGKGTWDAPPDFTEHGKEPLTKWLLKKLAAYEKETGEKLCDILDWHFYPQTGIYMGGKAGDPKVMEGRVEETRVLWDPQYKDPSWMGKETDKVIRLIPLMKEWIAECKPGMKTSIGEYNFGGEGDLSGGIAQAEILGIFAREGLDLAFYWFAPAPNTSPYFAYKMYRNPDGKQTAFGDRYLPAEVSAPYDVSVHAAKDTKSGRVTFVLINKRVGKPAKVTLKLGATLPAQDVTVYELSGRDRYAIGQWTKKVSGESVELDLPAFSVLRFDVKP